MWSWSHSDEGLAQARENLDKLEKEELNVIFAEWRAYDNEEIGYFNEEKYTKALVLAESLAGDILANDIWEKAEEQRNCDNGGFNLHMCPYGCISHCVNLEKE